MKLSAQLTLYIAIGFALLCLAYAGYGWHELGTVPDGQAHDDARGYVFFWLFLGVVGAASAWICWRMTRMQDER